MRDPNFISPIRSPRSTRSLFLNAANDATCEDADDLSNDDRLPLVVDPQLVQFILIRRGVVGRQELARAVFDAGDRAVDRRPVDMDVERGQEHRHLLP